MKGVRSRDVIVEAWNLVRSAPVWLGSLFRWCHSKTMRDHKSLMAWQEASAIVRAVFALTRGVKHPCVDQLQRAALSVQLNIAEGYALRSVKRFRNHLEIAYGSAVETTELLELMADLGISPSDLVQESMQRCNRCKGLLIGLIRRMRRA